MLNILTVLRSGGEYLPEHVVKLKESLAKHCSIPHAFYCLSDVSIPGVSVIPLRHNWPGWYSKMELYRSDLPKGPRFFLDLDTMIVRNCDSALNAAMGKPFVILRDFYRGEVNPKAMGSGLMYWETNLSPLYQWYASNPITVRGGDQSLLEEALDHRSVSYWQDITESVCSFKVHVRPLGQLVDKYSIVCLHGQPRPWNQTIIPYK